MVRIYSNLNVFGLTCQDAADLMNAESGDAYGESRWRKRFRVFHQGMLYERKRKTGDVLDRQTRELEKQKLLIAEQRAALKRELAADAKRDALVCEILDSIKSFQPIPLPDVLDGVVWNGGTLIAVLSDLHLGMSFSHQYGAYNTEIAKIRLAEYAARVRREAYRLEASECVVALAGDLVSGSIHPSIRAENRENAIAQIKTAGELVAQFVAAIAPTFRAVRVYGVGGNHSRLFPKDESVVTELLDNIIPWYLEARLKEFSNVTIDQDGCESALSVFDVEGQRVALVHGDYDALDEKSIARIKGVVGHVDLVLAGHMHECEFRDVMGTHVVRGGCLCGSGDSYSISRRLVSKPSQIMAYVERDSGLSAVLPVYFE